MTTQIRLFQLPTIAGVSTLTVPAGTEFLGVQMTSDPVVLALSNVDETEMEEEQILCVEGEQPMSLLGGTKYIGSVMLGLPFHYFHV